MIKKLNIAETIKNLMMLRWDSKAVSPIVSMILLIMIMLVVTAGILQWATPVIQRVQYEAHYRTMLGYFESLDLAIEDVVKAGMNSTREVSVSVGAGELYFGGGEDWRILYINETGTEKTDIFKIPSIEHRLASPFGTYITRFENLGIVTQAVGERWLVNEPIIIERKNSTVPEETIVYIYILNFTSAGIKSGTAGNYKFYIRLHSTNIIGPSKISNLTINITGDWRKTWYSYFRKDYDIENATGDITNFIGWAPDEAKDRIIYKTNRTKEYLTVPNELNWRAIIYDLEIVLKIT
ncbi:MAG: hypothetical protein QMC98_01275 [Candidatus Thermoplasmatota archaeon]|nr:hypothetical protein [Candidatus Thermoplasmatota archaeon]